MSNPHDKRASSSSYHTGRWTVKEHLLFLAGLKQHGRDWRSIQALIQTRTATQVRTHAQKFFTRDHYQATKRGRYASRLKDIETPDMMDALRHADVLTETSTKPGPSWFPEFESSSPTALQTHQRAIPQSHEPPQLKSFTQKRKFDDKTCELENEVSKSGFRWKLNTFECERSRINASTLDDRTEDYTGLMYLDKPSVALEDPDFRIKEEPALDFFAETSKPSQVCSSACDSEETCSPSSVTSQPSACIQVAHEGDCLNWLKAPSEQSYYIPQTTATVLHPIDQDNSSLRKIPSLFMNPRYHHPSCK